MSIPILYSAYTSSCSFRVRIALNIKKIKYKYIEMNLYDKNNELLKPYRKTNPNMKVPCLNIDGMDISESKVIWDYLDILYPDPPLYPTNILAYIRTNEVWEYINASIQPLQNTPVLNKIKGKNNFIVI